MSPVICILITVNITVWCRTARAIGWSHLEHSLFSTRMLCCDCCNYELLFCWSLFWWVIFLYQYATAHRTVFVFWFPLKLTMYSLWIKFIYRVLCYAVLCCIVLCLYHCVLHSSAVLYCTVLYCGLLCCILSTLPRYSRFLIPQFAVHCIACSLTRSTPHGSWIFHSID